MKRTTICLVAALTLLAIASSGMAKEQELIGAGATFPYPLYSKMFDVYSKEYGTKVNYQAIGSGGGIRQLINKTVDFGGSDAVMSEEDLKAAQAPVLHIPTVAGAVVVTYNISGNPSIKLAPDIVADIFLGKIKKWSDPRIVSANAGVKIPDMAITVVHRSDGSGTTNIFADYLSKVSNEWKEKVGTGTSLNWPVGLGGKGNPGVAGLVQQTPGSIGYVELIYALQNKMAFADIKNKKGNWVKPSIASTSKAANITLPDNMMVSLTDTDAADGYPVAGFTWILMYKEQQYGDRAQDKVDELVKLVWWMTHQGQKYAEPMEYAPLSKAAADKAERLIKAVTYGGKPVMK
ncbi:MAG TPA: phosphate ABC transporter substrate-binding protein PstS [Syntrophorhabdales bacterium]|nr:phosphate ABC transporter substrate-binding protein PstS [Syntrophorhabdales bacterium]